MASDDIIFLTAYVLCIVDAVDILRLACVSHTAECVAEAELLVFTQSEHIPPVADVFCRLVFAEAEALALCSQKAVFVLLFTVKPQIDVSLKFVSQVFKRSFVVHSDTSVNYIYRVRRAKKNPSLPTGTLKTMSPIGQALAPYLLAGCCAVIGLVPRALCIGVFRHYYNSRNIPESQDLTVQKNG